MHVLPTPARRVCAHSAAGGACDGRRAFHVRGRPIEYTRTHIRPIRAQRKAAVAALRNGGATPRESRFYEGPYIAGLHARRIIERRRVWVCALVHSRCSQAAAIA